MSSLRVFLQVQRAIFGEARNETASKQKEAASLDMLPLDMQVVGHWTCRLSVLFLWTIFEAVVS